MTIKKILIANRGEIACRIIKTCKRMGIKTVAVYSTIDKSSKHVLMADYALCVGGPSIIDSYCNQDSILTAASSLGCDAIHPGYGFLSENIEFAKKVNKTGLVFIGPSFSVLQQCEDKLWLKNQVKKLFIPTIKGSRSLITNFNQALEVVNQIGYPCVLKANNGAGGHHIYVIENKAQLEDIFLSTHADFNNGKAISYYMEKYLKDVKHIEVQLIADKFNNIQSIGIRNCSIQDNHQKVIEESCFSCSEMLKKQLIDDAISIARYLKMDNVCTVEFLVDQQDSHYFMEVNPRIQVEHPISEELSNIDLVQIQINSAMNGKLPQTISTKSIHVIEARLKLNDKKQSNIEYLYIPITDGLRVDSSMDTHAFIPPIYDGLIAKIIVSANNRKQAIAKLSATLFQTIVIGANTNLQQLQEIVSAPSFHSGNYTTQTLKKSVLKQTIEDEIICERCKNTINKQILKENVYVCPICTHHFKMPAQQLIDYLFKDSSYQEIDQHLTTNHNQSNKEYNTKLNEARSKTKIDEAIICVLGKLKIHEIALGVFEGEFLMGSMGSVVGEKITRLLEAANKKNIPCIIISTSGGARMQEGLQSLMQMAKVSLALTHFLKNNLFISVCSNPTMGGTTASFVMQGDITLSFSYAQIGFSGKRVVEQTLHQSFNQTIQRAEVLHSHGWIDKTIPRNQLRDNLLTILNFHQKKQFQPIQSSFLRKQANKSSSTYQKVLNARSLNRFNAEIIIQHIFETFYDFSSENIVSNSSLLCGLAMFHGFPITVIAQNKNQLAGQNGLLTPGEYRKIIKLVQQAEKFHRPIITIIDTPGADPSYSSEINGQSNAISDTLQSFSKVKVPIITIILSEGGSGGALAIGISDKTMMLENAYYSIISPEGYASILYKDAKKASKVAESMKITAFDCLEMNIVDDIVVEDDFDSIINQIKGYLFMYLNECLQIDTQTLLEKRYQRYRSIASSDDKLWDKES